MTRVGPHCDTVRTARAAAARSDWTAVRDALATATGLGTEELALLVDARWWLGQAEEYASAAAELHHRLLDAGQPVRAAVVAFELGFTEVVRGRGEHGLGWMARARRLLDEHPDVPEGGLLLLADAQAALTAGDLPAADDLAGQALALGERHGLGTVVALGRFLRGCVAVHAGRTAQGLRDIDEAMLPVAAGEVAPEWVGLIYCDTISLCLDLLDLPRARAWTELTVRWLAERGPAVLFTGTCRAHRAQLRLRRGEWAMAEQEATQAAAELEPLDVEVAGEAHYCLGDLHRLRGHLDDAHAAYRRAHERGRDPLPGMALLSLARGRPLVAASVLDAALAAEDRPLLRAPLLAARVEVCLAREDERGATAYLDELARVAETHESPGWAAEAQRLRGRLLISHGDSAAALRELRRAQARWRRMGADYEVCRIALDLAAAHEALGDHETARRERDAAAAVLIRLGVPERPAPEAPDLAGLTPREVEVVAAVAGGATNREAARVLHISERTVARHLANVYLKTGLSSRTAAVTWARERDLI